MGLRFFFLFLSFLSINMYSQTDIIKQINNYMLKKAEYKELIFVSIDQQKMYHIHNNKIYKSYDISSSKFGIGNKKGSNKTPLGLHKIKEKHGGNIPLNGRLIGRIFYGQIAEIFSDTTTSKTDDITSRVLWLEGLEKRINKGKDIDSYKRYIYIHGTSEEGKIGKPASHGCIRMKNKDVIDLFKEVSIGTFVLIL